MAIAAALNILVSANTAVLQKDLKGVGSTVGELRGILKEAFKGAETEADQLEHKIQVLKTALSSGGINWNQFNDARAKLKQAFTLDQTSQSDSARDQYIDKRNKAMASDTADRLAEQRAKEQEIAEEKRALARRLDEERAEEIAWLSALEAAAAKELDEEKRALNKRMSQERAVEIARLIALEAAAAAEVAEEKAAFAKRVDEERAAEIKRLQALEAAAVAEVAAEKEAFDKRINQERAAALAKQLAAEKSAAASLAAQREGAFSGAVQDGARVTQQHSARARYNAQMQELNQLLRMGTIEQSIFNQAQRAAQRELTGTAINVGQLRAALGLFNPYVIAAAAIGFTIREGAKFNSAMAQTAAVSNVSAKELDTLGASALSMAANSRYSAIQVAEAQQHLLKAGMSVNETLMAQRHIMDLATIGHVDLANATEIVARIMGAFQMSGADAGKVVDSLAVASTKTIGTVENLAEALKFVGPIAHSSGLSLNETVAALMVLHKQGLVGEMAGTGLRNVLVRLGAPTNEAMKAMRQFGVEIAATSKGGLDLAQTLTNLRHASKDLTGLDELKFYAELGKTRAAMTVAALTSGDFGSALADQNNSSGEAERRAAKAMDSLGGDFSKLTHAVSNSAIIFESQLDPALRKIVQFVTLIGGNHGGSAAFAQQTAMFAEVERLSTPADLDARVKQLQQFVTEMRAGGKGDKDISFDPAGTLGNPFGQSIETASTEIEMLKTKLAKAKEEASKFASAPYADIGMKAEDIGERLHKKLEELKGMSVEQAELNDLQAKYNALIAAGSNEQAHAVGAILAAQELLAKQVDTQTAIASITKAIHEFEKKNKDEDEATRLRREAIEKADAEYEFASMAAGTNRSQQFKADTEHAAKLAEIEKDTAELRKEMAQAEQSILDKNLEKRLQDLDVENEILRTQQRKADEFDKLAKQAEKFGAAEAAKVKAEVATARLKVEQNKELEKHISEKDALNKHLKEKADNPSKDIDPAQKFRHDYAELLAEKELGLIDEKRFKTDRLNLENSFLKSDAHHIEKPRFVEKGSQEEYKILYGNPVLDINRKQLRVQEQSQTTLAELNKNFLAKLDKPQIAKLPK